MRVVREGVYKQGYLMQGPLASNGRVNDPWT